MADGYLYNSLTQPIITPLSMLPTEVSVLFKNKKVLDFGIETRANIFEFNKKTCVAPNTLALSYCLGLAGAAKSRKVFLAGFDGYEGDDRRNEETEGTITDFSAACEIPVESITDTVYKIRSSSVYAD